MVHPLTVVNSHLPKAANSTPISVPPLNLEEELKQCEDVVPKGRTKGRTKCDGCDNSYIRINLHKCKGPKGKK